MSSPNDELRRYLINHGFSSIEVRNMSEKEVLETFSALADSDVLHEKSRPQAPNNVKKDNTDNYSRRAKDDPIFTTNLENAGLNDDEALRVALQESINYPSGSSNTATKQSNVRKNTNNYSNNRNSNSSIRESIKDLASNTFQALRDMVGFGESFFSIPQDCFNIPSDDDDEFAQYNQQKSQNQRINYPPPPQNPNTYDQRSKSKTSTNHENYYNTNDQNSYYSQYHYNDFITQNQQDDNFQYSSIPNIGRYYESNDTPAQNHNNPTINVESSTDDESDDFNNSSKIIQRQNEEIKKLEQEVAQKEREEHEKKLLEQEENNVKEACQISLADEIIDILSIIPPEPDEPKTAEEKKKVVNLQIILNDRKKIGRRFNDTDKGIFVYAWVAGTTLDSDEILYLNSFELKMPMGNIILDKNQTLGEQKVRGKVCFIVSELDQ